MSSLKAISNISEISYNGVMFRPYHPFLNNTAEDIKDTSNGYKNLINPMIAELNTNYVISKIQIILNHIKSVYANNDDFLYKYILIFLSTNN